MPSCQGRSPSATRATPARSIPTWAAGSRPGTWIAGAARSAIKLLAIGRNLANRYTTDREGKPASRDLARQHVGQHQQARATATSSIPIPAASGRRVYYVDDGGIAADPSLGGELEFMDPRGPGPAMYAPHLAFAMPGGLSVGANEVVHPKAGPAGHVPGLAAASGAALSRRRRAHLHRLQSQPVSFICRLRSRRRPSLRSCRPMSR